MTEAGSLTEAGWERAGAWEAAARVTLCRSAPLGVEGPSARRLERSRASERAPALFGLLARWHKTAAPQQAISKASPASRPAGPKIPARLLCIPHRRRIGWSDPLDREFDSLGDERPILMARSADSLKARLMVARFNPSQIVQFDLNHGQVRLDGSPFRLLVPADAVLALCKNAGNEALEAFGHQLGSEVGQRVQGRLGEEASGASLEDVLEHLGGDLALMGLGSLGAERWGRALVLTVQGSPLGSDGDPLLAAVVEGALQEAFGRAGRVLVLGREEDSVRLLVTNADAAEKVNHWMRDGSSWSEAISRLHTEHVGGAA